MFTRVVEIKSKSGKSKELTNAINEKVLPILKKQHGFVDEIVLVPDKETDRVLQSRLKGIPRKFGPPHCCDAEKAALVYLVDCKS